MVLCLEYVSPEDLRASPRNAPIHSIRQIEQIADSMGSFGFTNPILVDEQNAIIAGHGRLEAARRLKLSEVPIIRIGYLNEAQKRALMLADNKIALNAGWDLEILSAELADLDSLELNFDLEVTGFETAEIDLILGERRASDDVPTEIAPVPDPEVPVVSIPGDLWLLGNHRVLCGNARSSRDFETVMEGRVADAGFTDPPYNVPIVGHVSGKGRTRHREFAEASGEMSSEAFARFLSETLGNGAKSSREGAVWFCCMDWRHMAEMHMAGSAEFGDMLNLCVWAKTNGGMGSLYRSQHELVFVFRKGKRGHRNNVQLGRFGRNRTNLWTYPGVNSFRDGRMDELQAHPTAKPVAMIKDALMDVTRRGDRVLDPFLGAGATLIAAERCGRIAHGIEIDPAYVDVTLRRWRKETGQEPIRAADGRTLASIEAQIEMEVRS